jgi:hypothetical protein
MGNGYTGAIAMTTIPDDDDRVNPDLTHLGGAILDRYRICHPDCGQCETTSTREEAFDLADCLVSTGCYSDPYAFEV